MNQPLIKVSHVKNQFGKQVVHEDVDFEVRKGEILGVVGGSGSGKSVLLRTMTGLHNPTSGGVTIQGKKVSELQPQEVAGLFGVLFQQGALFSSLTVAQNIMMPLAEHTKIPAAMQEKIAVMKMALSELKPEAGGKFPSELSGGMVKRAALARALAMDPQILFLDEPTAGLDPLTAAAFDQLIIKLNRNLGITVVMVTHDLDSLFTLCHRVAVLVDRKVVIDTLPALMESNHPWIQEYFHGPRARSAETATGQAHGNR